MVPILALAGAASLLELGPIALLLRAHAGIPSLLLAGLAYQIGNALPRPPNVTTLPILMLSSLFGAVGLFMAPSASATWYASIALLSWSLQAVRRRLTTDQGDDLPSTVEKRSARVVGFVAATFLPTSAWLLVVALALAFGLARSNPISRATYASHRGPMGAIEMIMVLHQAHYFSYCYAIPLLLAGNELGGIAFVGLWFACGWISYLSAETLWRHNKPRAVFVVGHLCLAIILVLLTSYGDKPWWVLAMWVLSGLGGGTVYCLTLLHRDAYLPHMRLEHAEDTGHILGVVVALAATLLWNWSAEFLPVFGSIFAITAAVVMIASTIAKHAKKARTEPLSDGRANADQ